MLNNASQLIFNSSVEKTVERRPLPFTVYQNGFQSTQNDGQKRWGNLNLSLSLSLSLDIWKYWVSIRCGTHTTRIVRTPRQHKDIF